MGAILKCGSGDFLKAAVYWGRFSYFFFRLLLNVIATFFCICYIGKHDICQKKSRNGKHSALLNFSIVKYQPHHLGSQSGDSGHHRLSENIWFV